MAKAREKKIMKKKTRKYAILIFTIDFFKKNMRMMIHIQEKTLNTL